MSATPSQMRVEAKLVQETDFSKGAYLPNSEQQAILQLAGIEPSNGGNPDLPGRWGTWVPDPHSGKDPEPIEFSYYKSLRGPDKNRDPEPRIGRKVTTRMEVGKYLHIAWDGSSIFFYMRDSPAVSV